MFVFIAMLCGNIYLPIFCFIYICVTSKNVLRNNAGFHVHNFASVMIPMNAVSFIY